MAISTFALFIVMAGTSAAADGELTTGQVLLLGIGTTLGVVVQAVILLPILWRSGYSWRPRFDWRDAGLGKAGMLAAWTIGLVLVNQITYVFITRMATQANVNASNADVIAAGLTTYQKAHLVFMLPHSVITVSIVTAMLPALSRVAHDGRLAQVGKDVARTMRMVAMLIVPIAAVLMVNGAWIAILLFGYGAATPEQAGTMGLIVSVFMIGLLPFTLFYVLLRAYYALEDTRTPFFITIVFSVLFLALAFPLFQFGSSGGLQVAMLALAYSLSYWAGFVIAWSLLARRLGSLQSGSTAWMLARTLLAGIVSGLSMLGLFAWVLTNLVGDATSAAGDGLRPRLILLLMVVVSAVVGTVVFMVAAWALRVPEVTDVLSLLRRVGRRLRRGGSA